MEGTHGYSGSCGPGNRDYYFQKTFSVGIFKWLKKSSGKGFKKSAVIYRVIGPVVKDKMVYSRAKKICDLMDSGLWKETKKSERIK